MTDEREGWGWLVELTARLRAGSARDYEAATALEAAHALIMRQGEALRIAEAVLRHADAFETSDDGKIPLHSPFTAARLVRAAMGGRMTPPKPICKTCNGTEWICDGDHPPKPWADQPGSGPNACGCGAGKPCPVCNPLSKEKRG